MYYISVKAVNALPAFSASADAELFTQCPVPCRTITDHKIEKPYKGVKSVAQAHGYWKHRLEMT